MGVVLKFRIFQMSSEFVFRSFSDASDCQISNKKLLEFSKFLTKIPGSCLLSLAHYI